MNNLILIIALKSSIWMLEKDFMVDLQKFKNIAYLQMLRRNYEYLRNILNLK